MEKSKHTEGIEETGKIEEIEIIKITVEIEETGKIQETEKAKKTEEIWVGQTEKIKKTEEIEETEKAKKTEETEELEKIEETEEIEEIPIYPLEESLKSEVMSIYEGIGNNDKGTPSQFRSYLSERGSNLKEEQKVYLAYYWVTRNIKYDYDGLEKGTYTNDIEQLFPKRVAVCTGFSKLFKDLLLSMNYSESKIINIRGYAKGGGYSPLKEPEADHLWSAVEINGKWCLIDSTWGEGDTSDYFLCAPPKCFVRDHLPYGNDSLQFLENPITLQRFHEMTDIGGKEFCKLNIDIIEDKAVQKYLWKGKNIV